MLDDAESVSFWKREAAKCDPDELRYKASCLLVEGAEEALVALLRWMATPNREMDELEGFLPPEPWSWMPLHHLADLNLMDYGVSCRVGWVTEWGHAVLDFLEKHGLDESTWDDE